MPMTQELLLAILSMDSYNRGYGAGLGDQTNGLGGAGSQIGTATLRALPNSIDYSAWQSAGFYAAAYDTQYGKVISYRGTDNIDILGSDPGASDVWNGWVNAVGIPTSGLGLALQFYNSVTGSTYQAGPAANTILTGHSLGGGLAGFVASLSGTQAQLYDHMPFGLSGVLQYALDNPLSVVNPLDWPSILKLAQIQSAYTENEILQLARNSATGFAISALLYGSPIPGGLSALLESSVNKTSLESYSGIGTAALSDRALKLHMMDLLVNLQFAKDEAAAGRMTNDWQHEDIAPKLWAAYFNKAVAQTIGFLPAGTGGATAEEGKMGRAIAYSAIDEGTRVFGDTGIRAMFNDANDLGGIVMLPDGSDTIKQAAGALSEIFLQYAGQLAFGKVLQTSGIGALQGVLAVDPGKTVLTVDLSAQQWERGRLGGSGVPVIEGKRTLVDTAFGLAGSSITDTRAGADWLWKADVPPGKDTAEIIDRISFAAANDNLLTITRMAA